MTTHGGSHELPPHEERLRVLRELGVKIGQNILNQVQAEATSKLLYEFRDIMACGYKDVPEARCLDTTFFYVMTSPWSKSDFAMTRPRN